MAAFGGRIPSVIRQLVVEHAKADGYKTAYVGCSGNLTVERCLWLAGVRHLHSNDVTIYSSLIGNHFAGQPLGISLREEHRPEWGWITDEQWWGSPADQVATVMQVATAMQWWNKPAGYYRRMFAAWRSQFPELHARTIQRIDDYELKLESFDAEDVFSWIDRVPEDQAVLAYPPFVGFEGAYARDYAKLDGIFDWDGRPDYEFLEGDRAAQFWQKFPRFRYWHVCSNQPIPELDEFLRAKTKSTNRAPTLHVYTQPRARKAFLMPRQPAEPVMVPRLGPYDDLGDSVSLAPLSYGQFCTLRSQYMNKGIRPGKATLAVAVLVDGVLVGAFAMVPSTAPAEDVYMLSDFPVAPSKYGRLAKLIVAASLSDEAQKLCQRMINRRARTVSTTAFTNNPVSMKYRGLYKLAKRTETHVADEEWSSEVSVTSYYERKWELKYDAQLGRWPLQQVLDDWKKKHGKHVAEQVEARVAI